MEVGVAKQVRQSGVLDSGKDLTRRDLRDAGKAFKMNSLEECCELVLWQSVMSLAKVLVGIMSRSV